MPLVHIQGVYSQRETSKLVIYFSPNVGSRLKKENSLWRKKSLLIPHALIQQGIHKYVEKTSIRFNDKLLQSLFMKRKS